LGRKCSAKVNGFGWSTAKMGEVVAARTTTRASYGVEGSKSSRGEGGLYRTYSALHNKPELPFLAKLVCVTLFGPKTETRTFWQRFS
jgi:hypothetical protein